ncbi:MAG: hybrid sensor histidine kinase/response regulator [Chloroflexota bacterium]
MGIDRSAYLEAFREEMLEHLQVLTQGLLSLESRPEDAESVGEVFRRVHTIKGSARMMGFGEVADLAHSVEDVLDDLRSGKLRASPPLLDAMLTAVDLLRELVKAPSEGTAERPDVQAVLRWLGDLRGTREEATPVAPAPEPANHRSAGERPEGQQRETVRVEVTRIDTILNLAGELMVLDAARNQWMDEVGQLVEMLDTARAVAQGAGLRGLGEQALSLSRTATRTTKRYRRLVTQQSELVRELHYQISALRMLPAGAVFSALPRAARDLAREGEKEVKVVIEGEDTEIDREVLERVRNPLLHLLRNAVVHGIERPAERVLTGKPRAGMVRIAACTRGEQAFIEVEDDGAGVDFRAVREAAVERGMLNSEEAAALDDAECARLLFVPGFTTRSSVSEASGRGVGLDVVKSEVDALKGQALLETQVGEGTKVTLQLPITLAFTHVLLFEVGRVTYGIPCSSTQGIVEVPVGAVRTLRTQEAVDMEGRVVPLVWMDRILGAEARVATRASRWPAILMGPPERPVAFVVDRVTGDENVIVKPLGPVLRRVPHVSGGIVLGDGRVALLLSAAALVDGVRGMVAPEPVPGVHPSRRTRRILVVDDSAISRALERGILASAGYQVETAVDGLDALEKLRSGEFSLVVADVEMPRMDGLQLVSALRGDPQLSELPVVIVSARESDEDRRRGMEMGARAYVGKASFDKATLLDAIESLIS